MKAFSFYSLIALFIFTGTCFQDLQAQRTNSRHKKDKRTYTKPVTTYPGERVGDPPLEEDKEKPCPEGEQRIDQKTSQGAWKFVGFAFIPTGSDEDIDTFEMVKQVSEVLEGNYNGDLSPAIQYGQSTVTTDFIIYFFFERDVKTTTKTWVCINNKWVLKGTDVKTITQKDSSWAGPFTWTDINPVRLQKLRSAAIGKVNATN